MAHYAVRNVFNFVKIPNIHRVGSDKRKNHRAFHVSGIYAHTRKLYILYYILKKKVYRSGYDISVYSPYTMKEFSSIATK